MSKNGLVESEEALFLGGFWRALLKGQLRKNGHSIITPARPWVAKPHGGGGDAKKEVGSARPLSLKAPRQGLTAHGFKGPGLLLGT